MDTTGDGQFQCWNLSAKDAEKLQVLISRAQKYEAIEIRRAFEADGVTGWWYGAYQPTDEKFMAVAYITDRVVNLFGIDQTAMRCIGRNLGRNTAKRIGAASHSIFGPDAMVKAFWEGFESAGMTVGSNEPLNLSVLTEIKCRLNDAYVVRVAQKKDLPLVFDFLGEAFIDELGMDVRRMGKEAHEKYCAGLIGDGHALIGTHRGRPAFVGDFQETPMGIFIEHAFFPVAMRRPKVIRGIHARLAELLLEKSPTVLMYAPGNNEDLSTALGEVGYRVVMAGRMLRLK